MVALLIVVCLDIKELSWIQFKLSRMFGSNAYESDMTEWFTKEGDWDMYLIEIT